MPSINALQGPGNCGKSTTLIRLLQAIQSKYPTAIIQSVHSGTIDIAVIMDGINGLKIGIESQGDPSSRLRQSLLTFAAAHCDTIFCACRTSGMTVDWVNALHPPYGIHFIPQTRVANNYDPTNDATVASLMQLAGI